MSDHGIYQAVLNATDARENMEFNGAYCMQILGSFNRQIHLDETKTMRTMDLFDSSLL